MTVDPFNPHRSAKQYALEWENFLGFSGGLTYENADLRRDDNGAALAYRSVIAVNRANTLIADALNGLTLNVVYNEGYDPSKDKVIGSTEDAKVRHPFMRALNDAEVKSGVPLLTQVSGSINLYGESYIERIRNPAGYGVGLRWLNPLGMSFQEIDGEIAYYRYSWNSQNVARLELDDIAYFHTWNPQFDNYGAGKTLAGMDEINIKRNLQRYLRAFFRNNARLGQLITPSGDVKWSDGDVKRLEKAILDHFKGVDNAFRAMILHAKAEAQTFENPDIQKQYSVDDPITRAIFMLYGVPLAMAGDSSASAYKDGQEVLDAFYINTVLPFARQIARFINLHLMPFFDTTRNTRVKFDTSRFDKVAAADLNKSQKLTSEVTSGIISLGEARKQAGYDADATLDSLYMVQGVPVPYSELPNLWKQKFAAPPAAPAFANTTTTTSTDAGEVSAELDPATGKIRYVPVNAIVQHKSLKWHIKATATDQPQSYCLLATLAGVDRIRTVQDMVAAPDKLDARWIPPSDFHITLAYVNDALLTDVQAALPNNPNAFSVLVDRVDQFETPDGYAIYLRVRNGDIFAVQSALVQSLKDNGVQVGEFAEDFKPHITLAYSATPIEPRDITPFAIVVSGLVVSDDDHTEVIYQGLKKTILKHGDHTHTIPVETWDYTPQKALDELKAWRKFIANGTKRTFAPRYTRGDVGDFVTAQLKTAMPRAEIFKRAEAMLNTNGIAWMLPAFELALQAAAHANDAAFLKSIDDIRDDFMARFSPVIDDMRDGSLDSRQRAGNIIRQLLRTFGARAYRQGLADAGVDDAPDEAEQAEIDSLLSQQSGYVSNFTESLLKGDGISDAQARDRAAIWFNGSIAPFYNAGLLSGNKNLLMEFGGEDGEEICPTCIRMKGQRHRFKDYVKRDLDVPKIGQATECGGWKCLHRLIPVAGKPRGSW